MTNGLPYSYLSTTVSDWHIQTLLFPWDNRIMEQLNPSNHYLDSYYF